MTFVQMATMSSHPATIGHWTKDMLEADTKHALPELQAQMKELPVSEILRVANWITSSTFKRFYH